MWLFDRLTKREDFDRLFAYHTAQQVNVQDKWLGIMNVILQLTIISYYVGYVMFVNRGYLEYEAAKGVTATHVRGDYAAESSGRPGTRYFASEEITYPGLENGNVFIMTRMREYRQKRGVCEDPTMPCSSDADCHSHANGRCTEKHLCEEPSWCLVDPLEKPEVYELDTSNMLVWVKSSIQFVKLNEGLKHKKVFMSESAEEPGPRQYENPQARIENGLDPGNTFSVRDLLLMCDPPVRYEEVAELGASIEVQFIWDCNVEVEHCPVIINARRVDTLFDETNIGFGFSMPSYTGDGNERSIGRTRGVRLFFRTVGTGRKVSWTSIIMKVSTGVALLGVAPILADLMMLKVFSLGKKYHARKYEYSEDFSTYFANLEKERAERDIEKPAGFDEGDREVSQREADWKKALDADDD